MKKRLETDQVIDNLIAAMLGEDATQRQQYLLRESLRSLVRLAKSEQVMDIKTNVKKLTGAMDAHNARRRAKAVLFAQRLPNILASAQQQFEFN
ncbi:hypothetical protein [Noviherbaspirillum autotrophicum]|uniref:Uncharacterized protein n=1 Tax=Noviherbaspirillum autotrophicum TaxID=709839 RepID=A0A0C1Y6Q0_9BURK|nr:hypothetical protein [Noviherbaspirillum autotrophicum]KIF82638.1 hypothetical protein TSA66_20300 [Noviherbaspirillum autotrophicum]